MKIAHATRTSGDTYDVAYPGHADYDKDVSGAYLRRLVHDGYTVEIDQRGCRGEGEPEHETLRPTD